jgi:ATP-dependent RNA helicase RhlE
VINFDLPDVPETYVHRIGRTGRAGASGIALSFCDREEMVNLRDINKLIGLKIPAHPHPFEKANEDMAVSKPAPRSNAAPRQGKNQVHQKRFQGQFQHQSRPKQA